MDSETFVKKVLPLIRKILAKHLRNEFRFSQQKIAEKLFLTQASISYYLNDKRGISDFQLNEEIVSKIKDFCNRLANEKLTKKDLENFYDEIKNSL